MDVSCAEIGRFVLNKAKYVLAAIRKFEAACRFKPQPKKYVSGETLCILGRSLRLNPTFHVRMKKFTDDIRARISSMPGWAQTEWWPGWKSLPRAILNWDGDFLADYLDGDKRHVLDLLLEEIKAIQSLMPQ